VKVGATVTFSGSFVQHPLQAAGGDSPNPIPYTAANPPGGKLVVAMPTAGTFGFECEFHPKQMFGAIRVVP
jgi:plastocyanin